MNKVIIENTIQSLKMRLDSLEDAVGQLHIEVMENTDSVRRWLLVDTKFKESLIERLKISKDGD
jgi:hypothetical protein